MDQGRRVEFSERQRLLASDLRAEQDYLLGQAGRHHLGPHDWGIIRGLRLSLDSGQVTIKRGIAVDGYGRELVLWQDVSRTIEGQHETWYVYLYYCERPQGGCSPTPPSRWHDSAEITVSPERWPVPVDKLSIGTARAAGNGAGASPWPILLGTISENSVDSTMAPFTRLRASRVLSPSGQAMLQIGQEKRADPYHLRVSERDATGTMKDRFAVDRDGNSALWGDLTLTGTDRSAYVSVGGTRLKLTMQCGANGPITHRIIPLEQEPGKRVILRDSDGHEESYEFRVKSLARDCRKCERESRMIDVKRIGSGKGTKKVQARQSKVEQEPDVSAVVDDRAITFEYDGGNVSFEPEEDRSSPIACGCEGEQEKPKDLPEGLLFYPGQASPKFPSRDVQYLKVTPSDKPPVNELRMSGGAFKDGDLSPRVTTGGQLTDQGPFAPWLTMRGNGTIELLGAKASINAIGTVQLSPIKPDPRDPLFNYLTVFAFTQGVASVSSALINAEISKAVLDGMNLQYDLTVTNESRTSVMVLEQGIAFFVAGDSGLARIEPIKDVKGRQLAPTTPTTFTVTHKLDGMRSPNSVVLKVTVTANVDKLTVAHTTVPMTVKRQSQPPIG